MTQRKSQEDAVIFLLSGVRFPQLRGLYYGKKESYSGRNRAEGKHPGTAAGEQCKQVLGEKKSRKSFSDFLLGGATVRVAVIYFISV